MGKIHLENPRPTHAKCLDFQWYGNSTKDERRGSTLQEVSTTIESVSEISSIVRIIERLSEPSQNLQVCSFEFNFREDEDESRIMAPHQWIDFFPSCPILKVLTCNVDGDNDPENLLDSRSARKQNVRSVLEIEGVAMQTLKKLVIPFKMFDTSS